MRDIDQKIIDKVGAELTEQVNLNRGSSSFAIKQLAKGYQHLARCVSCQIDVNMERICKLPQQAPVVYTAVAMLGVALAVRLLEEAESGSDEAGEADTVAIQERSSDDEATANAG